MKFVPLDIWVLDRIFLNNESLQIFLSGQWPDQLCLIMEKLELCIYVADVGVIVACRTPRKKLLFFDGWSALLDVLVINEMVVAMGIGTKILEHLETHIDMGHSFVFVTIDGIVVQLSFEYQTEKLNLIRAPMNLIMTNLLWITEFLRPKLFLNQTKRRLLMQCFKVTWTPKTVYKQICKTLMFWGLDSLPYPRLTRKTRMSLKVTMR